MTTGPWRAMLRLAGREVVRDRSRSLLVVALVGLPVLLLTTGAVLARSYHVAPSVAYARANGAASVELSPAGGAVTQNPAGTLSDQVGPAREKVRLCGRAPALREPCSSTAAVARLLGPGAQVVERRTDDALTVVTPAGAATATLVGVDYRGPVASGVALQVSGRAPRLVGEVDVTAALASEAHLRIGSTLATVAPKLDLHVVGILADPVRSGVAEAYTLPATLDGPLIRSGAVVTDYLARTARPVPWPEVRRLNAEGWVVQSRQVVAHPPPAALVDFADPSPALVAGRFDRTEVVSAGLLVGMALLEVVLLAGPAFAVAARRQQRTLAMIAAVGGRRRDLRNAVLAQGALLGAAAAASGLGLGTLSAHLLEPVLAAHAGHRFGPFTVRAADLAGIGAVSLITALAAAAMPARAAAATDVVAALAGRRPRRPAQRRVPATAVVIAGLGVLVALGGARRPGTDTVPILVGVALLEVGIIVATPTILLVVAGLGRHLPFGPRLALRDAGRNRSSAAPAVAAIMAAVIGCTAVLLGVAAENAQQRRTYQPQALRGEVSFLVGSLDGGSAQVATAVSAAMRATLPARTVVVVSDPGRSCPGSSNHCTVPAPEVTPVVPAGTVRTTRYANGSGGQAVVAGPGALEALTGVDAPTAEAALRAGHAVVADGWAVHDGVAALQVERYLASGPKTTTVDVPAVALTRGFAAAQVILPPSLAARIGVGSNPVTVLAATTRMPTSAELQALQAALDRVEATFPAAVGGLRPVARVERGWQDHDGTRMVLLLLAAAVVAVAAAGIATGLTNAERATDMGVVEAVGGSRRTLRLVSVSRAGVIAGIGVVLGTAAGFVPALAFILSRNRGLGGAGAVGAAPGGAGVLLTPSPSYALHLTVPWLAMTVLVVGIPLVAAGLAGLLSRPSVVTGRRRVGPA